MLVPAHQQEARVILSRCMVSILRPSSATDQDTPVNERLIGYAIAACVYAGRPATLYGLAKATGLPRSTVRGVIHSLMGKEWVIRNPDKSFDFSPEFHQCADAWFNLPAKYQAVIEAGEALRGLTNGVQTETDL